MHLTGLILNKLCVSPGPKNHMGHDPRGPMLKAVLCIKGGGWANSWAFRDWTAPCNEAQMSLSCKTAQAHRRDDSENRMRVVCRLTALSMPFAGITCDFLFLRPIRKIDVLIPWDIFRYHFLFLGAMSCQLVHNMTNHSHFRRKRN